jgi:hypothetical protein
LGSPSAFFLCFSCSIALLLDWIKKKNEKKGKRREKKRKRKEKQGKELVAAIGLPYKP